MDSMLVLLLPDGVASKISEFRENFTDNDLNSFPAFINVFETFVASKDINKTLNRLSRSQATPVTLEFDSISYKQIDHDLWSVTYLLSGPSVPVFNNLWNQFRRSSTSSIIQANLAPEPYLHITNCSRDEIEDLQKDAQAELGCLTFEVNTIAALCFQPELAVVSRKFGRKRPVVKPMVIEHPDPVYERKEQTRPRPVERKPVERNYFQLESQPADFETCDDDWLDFGIETGGLVSDYVWNQHIEDFGTRGYYLTRRVLKCQTVKGSATLPVNTVVLVQSIKNRRAEITAPQEGWIDFSANLLTPLWKPEMRPGLYKTTCTVQVNGKDIPKDTTVVVNFTAQTKKRGFDEEGKRTMVPTGKVTNRVHVSTQGKKKVKGFMTIHTKKNKMVLKYKNRCFAGRKFQDVSLTNPIHAIAGNGVKAFKAFPTLPVPSAEVAESVISEALSLKTVATSVSGVSSRSSSSIRSLKTVSKTGSKFGQAGIYVLKHNHNVHVSQDFNQGLVSDDRYNKKEKCWIKKDALIRKGQPVSVWKTVGDRAQIIAPFEGWIKFGRELADLKTFSVKQGELFQVRARKPTLVLSSNSMNGYKVDRLKKGTKVKVERVEGASALISLPVHGWIDIIASAMTKFKVSAVKPKLVLGQVPVKLAENKQMLESFLKKSGIKGTVHTFAKPPRKVKKWVAVDSKRSSKKHWDIKKKEKYVDDDFTTVNLTFESMEDAQLALQQSFVNPWVPTHTMPLKWSSHYKKLTA